MMDSLHECEESFREAASIGDDQAVQKFIGENCNINSQNSMNKWTALHWAAHRGHVGIISQLLNAGADTTITNDKGNTPCDLATSSNIIQLLGGDSSKKIHTAPELPITPNYIVNPAFPHVTRNNSNQLHSEPQQEACLPTSLNGSPQQELILKARIANSAETDFIEVEMDRSSLNFDTLLALLCTELDVKREVVSKVRKLPNTIVRKDKDVARLLDLQELELVLSTMAMSMLPSTYDAAPRQQPGNILY